MTSFGPGAAFAMLAIGKRLALLLVGVAGYYVICALVIRWWQPQLPELGARRA